MRKNFLGNFLYAWLAFNTVIDYLYKSPIAGSGKLLRALMNAFKELLLNVVPEAHSLDPDAYLNHPVTDPLQFLLCLVFHELSDVLWNAET